MISREAIFINNTLKMSIAGFIAGAVNGLFGAGGGMLLIPLLTKLSDLQDDDVFPASVSIIFPICFVSLTIYASASGLPISDALPYLLGGAVGGIVAGLTGNRIPVKWLHRILGIMILWGGYRYLC